MIKKAMKFYEKRPVLANTILGVVVGGTMLLGILGAMLYISFSV